MMLVALTVHTERHPICMTVQLSVQVSGTDSPYRETSNIYYGSAFCAGSVHYFSIKITQNKTCVLLHLTYNSKSR